MNLKNLDADSAGINPLEEAILGKHESVIKLLLQHGAEIAASDAGHFACALVEQNSLDLLNDMARGGYDVTLPRSDGTTALHAAVCEGNVEIARFLVEQGAGIDEADVRGWTPRDLAEQQGHEEIKALFLRKPGVKAPPFPKEQRAPPKLAKFKSDPAMPSYSPEGSVGKSSTRRRRLSNFSNSLFGMMSAANIGDHLTFISRLLVLYIRLLNTRKSPKLRSYSFC